MHSNGDLRYFMVDKYNKLIHDTQILSRINFLLYCLDYIAGSILAHWRNKKLSIQNQCHKISLQSNATILYQMFMKKYTSKSATDIKLISLISSEIHNYNIYFTMQSLKYFFMLEKSFKKLFFHHSVSI